LKIAAAPEEDHLVTPGPDPGIQPGLESTPGAGLNRRDEPGDHKTSGLAEHPVKLSGQRP